MKTKLFATLALVALISSNAPVTISYQEKGIAGGEMKEVNYDGSLKDLAEQINIFSGFEPGTVLELEIEHEMAKILERDALNEKYVVVSVDEEASHLVLSVVKLTPRSVVIKAPLRAGKYLMMDCSNDRFYCIYWPKDSLVTREYNLHKLINAGSHVTAYYTYNTVGVVKVYHGLVKVYKLVQNAKKVKVPLSEKALQILESEYENIFSDTQRSACFERIWAAMSEAGIEVQELPDDFYDNFMPA